MIEREHFYATIRNAWGPLPQSRVDALTFLLDRMDADIAAGRLGPRQAAYLLATTKHEAADTYLPIFERGPKVYFLKYEWRRKSLGNTEKGDGYRFRGADLS